MTDKERTALFWESLVMAIKSNRGFWMGPFRLFFAVLTTFLVMQTRADGPTIKRIALQHSQYPFDCYATMCFNPESEKQSDLRNQEETARLHCAHFSKQACEREQELLEAKQQCYSSICATARCRNVSVTGGGCVGGAYFD